MINTISKDTITYLNNLRDLNKEYGYAKVEKASILLDKLIQENFVEIEELLHKEKLQLKIILTDKFLYLTNLEILEKITNQPLEKIKERIL